MWISPLMSSVRCISSSLSKSSARSACSLILSGRVTSGFRKNCGSSFLPSNWLLSWIVSMSATELGRTRKKRKSRFSCSFFFCNYYCHYFNPRSPGLLGIPQYIASNVLDNSFISYFVLLVNVFAFFSSDFDALDFPILIQHRFHLQLTFICCLDFFQAQ